MDKDKLQQLIDDDEYGLLAIKPTASPVAAADERLLKGFLEINKFIKEQGRFPEPNNGVAELRLYSRLEGLKNQVDKCLTLKPYDEFDLLDSVAKPVQSLEDLLADDDLSILSNDADEIFVLKHVSAKSPEIAPNYIARRESFEDFERYEYLFKNCQKDLAAGNRRLSPFSQGSEIYQGDFFVLKGMLVYVADMRAREEQPGAEPGRLNNRLHCIFENGTHSDMLMRSLAARLYEEAGQRVSKNTEFPFRVNEVTEEDEQTGFIYVLKSLSTKPEIKSRKNLYKIGFSRSSVEERVKNAPQEPTYLMAPVAIMTTFRCFNLKPHRLENLLHTFFGAACLEIEVRDEEGNAFIPKEWFIAPIQVITRAVELLISGEITEYEYDVDREQIKRRGVIEQL
jgi:hypothetical protein